MPKEITKDFLSHITNLYNNSCREKSKYSIRWSKIASLTGTVCPLSIFDESSITTNKQDTEQYEIDASVFDPTSSQAVFTLSNYIFTMLFGNKQKFLLKADNEDDQNFYDSIATASVKIFENENSNFVCASRHMLETSDIPFGNGGYLFTEDKEEKLIYFEPLTIVDAHIVEGRYNKLDGIFLDVLISGVEFQAKFGDMPKEIKDKFEKDGIIKDIQLVYFIGNNPDYDKEAKDGVNSQKYIGVYFCDKAEKSDWSFVNTFDYQRFVFHRNITMRGELYARGNIDRVLSSVGSMNELVRMANDSVERMENPAIGITAEVNSDTVIDMTPGGVNVLTPMPGQNGTPMFAMQPTGDPSGILKLMLPRYDTAFVGAFGLNMFLDVNPVAGMTARQVLDATITRNKNLLPVYLGYREQILFPMYKIIVDRVIKNKWYEFDGKTPRDKSKFTVIPLTAMEEVYTSNIMDKLMEISNVVVSLRGVIPESEILFTIYPMVKNALKGSKYEPYFVSETKFKKRVMELSKIKSQQMMMNGGNIDNKLKQSPQTPEGDIATAQGSAE